MLYSNNPLNKRIVFHAAKRTDSQVLEVTSTYNCVIHYEAATDIVMQSWDKNMACQNRCNVNAN